MVVRINEWEVTNWQNHMFHIHRPDLSNRKTDNHKMDISSIVSSCSCKYLLVNFEKGLCLGFTDRTLIRRFVFTCITTHGAYIITVNVLRVIQAVQSFLIKICMDFFNRIEGYPGCPEFFDKDLHGLLQPHWRM